jgi:hypothetical protein
MCGKFTAMASWREVHAFSHPLTADAGLGSNDEVVTYRVAGMLTGRLDNGASFPCEEVGSKTVQWTIDPKDGIPRGFAFLWRRFDIPGLPAPMLACVMATVPASRLIAPITDRMPAILEDNDWRRWLGEEPAELSQVKAVLNTMEGVNWRMANEPPNPKPAKAKSACPSV